MRTILVLMVLTLALIGLGAADMTIGYPEWIYGAIYCPHYCMPMIPILNYSPVTPYTGFVGYLDQFGNAQVAYVDNSDIITGW